MSFFLNQISAQALDVELMSTGGFTLDQLMELAGLAVASALLHAFPSATRVLAICGPGNNGGDALVASRHLHHFGKQVTVLYPKRPSKPELFTSLVTQLKDLDVQFTDTMPRDYDARFDVILDGVFGFSFNAKNGVRAPFDGILPELRQSKVPIASIDVPSGWDVERGDVYGLGVAQPDLLISLTAPKLCAKHFTGKHHYVGGRFLPPKLAQKYGLVSIGSLYAGSDQYARVDSEVIWQLEQASVSASSSKKPKSEL